MKFGFRKARAIAKEVQLEKSNPDAHGHPHSCLNCGATLTGHFCVACGQPASTHRMSFRHFLVHDVAHGIFHLDKGIIFTLKQILTRPGKAAREYLAGRRVGYFNLLTLLSLVAALYLFVQSLTPDDVAVTSSPDKAFIAFFVHFAKWLILSSGFLFAFSSFLIFKRVRLNYTEHLILNGFLLAGILVINTLETLLYFVNAESTWLTVTLTTAYIGWGYWGAFRGEYSLWGWLWRMLVHLLLAAVFLLSIAVAGIAIFRRH